MSLDVYANNWVNYPFPHIVIDNYLPENEFKKLSKELESTDTKLQRKFKTALENKEIHKDETLKQNARKLINNMSSEEIKKFISKKIKSLPLISLGEKKDYSGYSPFHTTYFGGFLGSHIDHSSIENGDLIHVANTIFYASTEWKKNWGGETILFSNNGFFQKVKISPKPNRLIIFIHCANSWHGVSKYNPKKEVTRKTFYHDYYISKVHRDNFITCINKNRKNKLTFSTHSTTFIPFIPNGINNISLKNFFLKSNLKYLKVYFIYLINKFFKTDFG